MCGVVSAVYVVAMSWFGTCLSKYQLLCACVVRLQREELAVSNIEVWTLIYIYMCVAHEVAVVFK